jgi:hypothetical protein
LTTMLAEQAAQPGILTVDIVTFDDVIEWQCSMADPASVKVVLEPRGGTALFDAIGMSVLQFGHILEALPEHARPETVQVVVVTDGHENSSREYPPDAVRALVKQQTDKYQWDFVFLGANQDAVLTGTALGFEAGSSMTYAARADKVGTMSSTLNRYVRDVRGKTKRGFTQTERNEAGDEPEL